MDLLGRRLGDFEIVRELGRGGMGVVFEAKQLSLSRRVALKVLSPGLGLTARAVDRFHREAEAAAKLHHTNIVPVYATGEDDGIHYYAMELIDGPSLDKVLRTLRPAATPSSHDLTGDYVDSAGLPEGLRNTSSSMGLSSDSRYFDTAATMIAEVADALDHAHGHKVLHRDIKPANLLLGPDGHLSVNDFGLARMLEQPGLTMTGEFVGTPAYMSPEQITGGRIPIDHRTDIYSLGGVLYELLTRQPPFVAERRDQLLALVVQKEPKPPRSLDRRVPVDLETICLKCLEKDPDRRYASAKALAEDLRRFVNRYAITAKRAGPLGRSRKWARRNPTVAALAALLLATFGLAGFFAWQARTAEHQRLVEHQRQAEVAKAEKRREVMQRGMVDALAGNIAGVDQAIDEAISLDADAADVRLLRGFAANSAGRSLEAIAHYEEAVRLRPDRAVARALLTDSYVCDFRWNEGQRSLKVLETLAKPNPEDLLFSGMVYCEFADPRGLPMIDEAMARKPMVIGFMVRANARMQNIFDTGSLAELETALQDNATARQVLPATTNVLLNHLNALGSAALIYHRAGAAEKLNETIAAGDLLARQLAGQSNNSDALCARCQWLQTVAWTRGGTPHYPKELAAVRASSGSRVLAALEAEQCFVSRQDREAAAILLPHAGYFYVDFIRFLTMLDRDEAAAERERILHEADSQSGGYLIPETVRLMRIALGRRAEGDRGIRRALLREDFFWPPNEKTPWEAYFRSDAPDREQGLLKKIAHSRTQTANAAFELGLRYFGERNWEEARKWFQLCADNGDPTRSRHAFSWMILARWKADPAWPRALRK